MYVKNTTENFPYREKRKIKFLNQERAVHIQKWERRYCNSVYRKGGIRSCSYSGL